MNRIALILFTLLPLATIQDRDVDTRFELEWHDLRTANVLAIETGRPLLVVFR